MDGNKDKNKTNKNKREKLQKETTRVLYYDLFRVGTRFKESVGVTLDEHSFLGILVLALG